ncbi:MAG: Rha family transcriptional regulator [Bacteroidales bacterium]|nr:Rha family transcriptional regulator [Bacteroidales bacterium]
MNELVINQNGKSVTNSLLVAKKFGKQHKNVIASIKSIIQLAENSADLKLFIESTYYDEQFKEQPVYVMDRDGFSLLVMGFTGKKAMKFKIDFINAFNEMEEKLKVISKPLSTLDILEHSIKQLREQEERVKTIEDDVLVLKAKNKTRPDYFTIAGYATLNKIQLGLKLASSLGKKATSICNKLQYPTETIPDPRFGIVNMYPKEVLKKVFDEHIVSGKLT